MRREDKGREIERDIKDIRVGAKVDLSMFFDLYFVCSSAFWCMCR